MTVEFLAAVTPLLAQAAADSQQPAWTQLIFPIGLVGIFYFALLRPQMKAKKEQDKLIAGVKSGDKVTTSGGLLGVVSNVKDKTVLVKVADNVKIEVLKTHLISVTKPENAPAE